MTRTATLGACAIATLACMAVLAACQRPEHGKPYSQRPASSPAGRANGVAIRLNVKGNYARDNADYDSALYYHTQARETAQVYRLTDREISALTNMGDDYDERGVPRDDIEYKPPARYHHDADLDSAVMCYNRAIALADSSGKPSQACEVMGDLGCCYLRDDRTLGRAESVLTLAVSRSRELGNTAALGIARYNLGIVHGKLGRLAQARVEFESSLAACSRAGEPDFTPQAEAMVQMFRYYELFNIPGARDSLIAKFRALGNPGARGE